jgi:serine/threonine-protein kinase
MLVTADEVAAGNIPHAIRFILPNARIRGGNVFVHPGTHTTGATSGGSNAPPYGVHFRLRANYPIGNLSSGAQVVAKAMQKYGMLLADGGNIALTFASDQFTQHKWSAVNVTSQSLTALAVSDFEVVDLGSTVSTGGCTRNP